MAVPVAEYVIEDGVLRIIRWGTGAGTGRACGKKQVEPTVKVKPEEEEKPVPPVMEKPVKSPEKVAERKPQQSVQKRTTVVAQKRQQQVRRNNAVQSSKMAEKARMEEKKQAHVEVFQSDERALPYVNWAIVHRMISIFGDDKEYV